MAVSLDAAVHYFCNFNAIALALLAFQNAGYIVLMGYANQLQDAPPAPGAPPKKKFLSTHFIATTEFVKIILCTVWCMVDVLLEMLKQDQEAADQTTIDVEHEELLLEKKDGVSGGDAFAERVARAARDGRRLPLSSQTSPILKNPATTDFPASPSKYSVRLTMSSLYRLTARPNFRQQFASRMRHAIGFDGKYKEALLMIVPAVLYTIQGLLLILSLKYLDPTVFQILYQVRIMFLAVMMRVVLDFKLSPIRWMALVALMVGIVLAQLAMQRKSEAAGADAKKPQASWSVEGTLAALTGAFMSAFSGVFMEYVYKKRGSLFTLSARSVHLAFFSLAYFWLVFAVDIVNSEHQDLPLSNRIGDFFATFFDGFTGLVWVLVVLQAMGGILVGLVVRYCDNIVKSFSTAFAIVLSGMASVYLFSLPLSPLFLLGSFLVMTSITVYSLKK